MKDFPRTNIGGISVSRLVIGTNWLLGFSHTSKAKDNFIRENIGIRKKMADIFEVFLNHGIDTIVAPPRELLVQAIQEAQDRIGKKMIYISTPAFPVNKDTPVSGFCNDETKKILEQEAKSGAAICMPHQCTTDAMVDRCSRTIRKMDTLMKMIREFDMVPGLSTHMPETIVYADETGLDTETYISIFNAMGFLMQIEVDWVSKIIQNARKPVLTIKPFASGQIRPLQGLTFVWNAIRPQDMVAVGVMSPDEAKEIIEISFAILEKRFPDYQLQETRSKKSIK
ncbi:MAG TPA: hypothetical protein PK165_07755 [bacterium]|nr:hypothetical protein [bacterium]HPO52708.1 hypothetical protein [bacterium]HXK44969.1 hypothetical protein [bacterium]